MKKFYNPRPRPRGYIFVFMHNSSELENSNSYKVKALHFAEAFMVCDIRFSRNLSYLNDRNRRCFVFPIQSTLVISKSKGLSKTLRDIRTSTYQICSIEEKIYSNSQISQINM